MLAGHGQAASDNGLECDFAPLGDIHTLAVMVDVLVEIAVRENALGALAAVEATIDPALPIIA